MPHEEEPNKFVDQSFYGRTDGMSKNMWLSLLKADHDNDEERIRKVLNEERNERNDRLK